MKEKFVKAHMKVAETYAELSSAVRLKVGCVIVKNDTIIGIGYNGTPSGWSNVCEDKEYMTDAGGWLNPDEIEERWPYQEQQLPKESGIWRRYRLVTKREVLHAETNAIAKVARSTNSTEGATLLVTHAPCIDCAKIIHQSGISKVYFKKQYRSEEGIELLRTCGIEVEQVT